MGDEESRWSEEDLENCSSGGIWFCGGGINKLTYEIQGDDVSSSAAFTAFDSEEAFEVWTTLYVNLHDEMDEYAYFFVRGEDPEKIEGPVYCVPQDEGCCDIEDFEDDLSDEEMERMDEGEAPEGWLRITAAQAEPFVEFEYANVY